MRQALGNDPDQLDRLRDMFTKWAERLGAIGSEVSGLLAHAGWRAATPKSSGGSGTIS